MKLSNNEAWGRIKPIFKCDEAFKKKFATSHCLLTISVGQEVHEGEKFYTTIGLVSSAFSQCTILVDDSLQRHSMMLSDFSHPEDVLQQSIIEGDRWLERNRELYETLQIPYEIIRWDKWLYHENYSYYHDLILKRYNTDQDYKRAIDSSAQDFISRYMRRLDNNDFDYDRGLGLCFDYLLEECVAMCLWVEGAYDFEVYPNKRNAAMTATHNIFVKENNPDLLNAVAIKFKNRKQLRPQIFTTEMVEQQ